MSFGFRGFQLPCCWTFGLCCRWFRSCIFQVTSWEPRSSGKQKGSEWQSLILPCSPLERIALDLFTSQQECSVSSMKAHDRSRSSKLSLQWTCWLSDQWREQFSTERGQSQSAGRAMWHRQHDVTDFKRDVTSAEWTARAGKMWNKETTGKTKA
jgi:hypothetical protein